MTLKKRYIAALLIVAVLLGGVGAYLGIQIAQPEAASNGTTDLALDEGEQFGDLSPEEQEKFMEQMKAMGGEMSKVSQAYNLIQDNYLEKMEDKELVAGAIQGMLNTLDDPYSTYMDKETVEEFNHQIESSFEGIGAEVSMVEGKVTIIAPIKGSPAEDAGLKPNDQILEVNEKSVEGLDLYDAVSKIRGKKGTSVTLEVKRPGVSETLSIELVRDDIPLETVYSETKTIDGKKTGVIEITSFSEKTAQHFNEQLKKLEKESIEGLVIDVRGNPGGLFTSVEEILKNFIPKDQPYVQIEDRKGEKSRYFSELEQKKSYPISVLIDEGSASASEILAAAMQEATGYELVGTTSFGKGTVQQSIPMGDGSNIKLTLFKWLTPEGNWIHEKGIKPTVKVKQPDYFYTNPIQIEEPLTANQSGDNIKNVQIMLKGLGYDPGREDGYFSKQTVQAVKSYQEDSDLKVTGEINKQTAGKIEATIVQQVSSGEDDKQMEKALEVLYQ